MPESPVKTTPLIMSHSSGSKAIIAALSANLGIAIAKLVGFILTGASSMLAEAIHSAADSGNQGLLLLGKHQAEKGPSEKHPFGRGKERYFWSFIVAIVIFMLGGAFAIHEGIEKLFHPGKLESPMIAIAIIGTSILLESYSLYTAYVEASKQKAEKSWWNYLQTSQDAELPVVLLEDVGALVGLVIALVALSLSAITGNAVFDALGTLSIGIILSVIAIILAMRMKSLLVGESASSELLMQTRDIISSHDAVARLIHLKTLVLGPTEVLVAAKIYWKTPIELAQISQAQNEIETAIRDLRDETCSIYLESDIYRA